MLFALTWCLIPLMVALVLVSAKRVEWSDSSVEVKALLLKWLHAFEVKLSIDATSEDKTGAAQSMYSDKIEEK